MTGASASAIADEAALWLVRREDPAWTTHDDAALQRWLDESMAHKAAFWRLEHGWREADRIAALGREPIAPPRRRWRPAMSALRRPATTIGAMVAAAAAAIALVGDWTPHPATPDAEVLASYRTPLGGNRTLKLADGSNVQLNTATRIRASTRADAREVWLDDGEAFFDIVHRPDRRFVVHAGARTITVLGTRFSVRRDGERVTVAVLSGKVQVDDAQAPASVPRTAIVSAGNVAIVEPRSTLISTTGSASVTALTAWRDRMIVFDDKPLAEIAQEFNRYSTRPIRIADPALGRVRMGGAFKTSDSDAFVELLRTAYGVRVRREGDGVVLSH